MHRFKLAAALALSGAMLTGCMTNPIQPMYVPPTKYQGYDCRQLGMEADRVSQYLQRGVEAPSSQAVGFGIGLGGWGGRWGGWGIQPRVSMDMNQAQETRRTAIARLLGERDAIIQAARLKGCQVNLNVAPPTNGPTTTIPAPAQPNVYPNPPGYGYPRIS